MKTVIYTKAIVDGVELYQFISEIGTQIKMFLMPSDPTVNNFSVSPHNTILNMKLSDAEFERHMKLNPQIEWVAL